MSAMTTPLPESPDLEKYQIYSRFEIISILREIMQRHVLVTIHFGGGVKFIVTNLLTVNPEFEEIVFDFGAEMETNIALTKANRFTVVTFLSHVKVQFSGQRIEQTIYEGSQALRMRLPESVLRFQRREFFRSPVMGKPIACHIPRPKEAGGPISARILNISVGGVGVLAWGDGESCAPGMSFNDCQIDLPELGNITASIEICNTSDIMLPNGSTQKRVGCRFKNMPGSMTTMIQRYVNMIERNKLARE